MLKLLVTLVFGVLVSQSFGFYSSGDKVIELTAENFNSKVLPSDCLWFVEFYAPWCGHCKSLAPEWIKAAKALKGVVKFGAVDMDQHPSVGGPYNIQGFPTIKIFGANKNKAIDYNAGRTAEAIVNEAINQLKNMANDRLGIKSSGGSNDVIELTESNFESEVLYSGDIWLVEFFAPWCGHCKNLAPEWAKAATELKGKVKLGAVDATIHQGLAAKYNIRGYPTIKYFGPGTKYHSSAEDYDGGRSASKIVDWALNKYSQNLPAPNIIELTNQTKLEESCNSKQICIISFLPKILDCQSQCRNAYIDTLKTFGEKYKKQEWGWLWTESMKQPELENALGVSGYPAMVAVNSQKGKYVSLKGSFVENDLNEFLRDLSLGRGATEPIPNSKLPEIKKSEPWDGKDDQLVLDGEIDLDALKISEPKSEL